MQVAEFVVANHFNVVEALAELLFEHGEQFVASKEVVPKERDAHTVESWEPLSASMRLYAPGRAGPNNVVVRCHPNMMLAVWDCRTFAEAPT